MSTETDLRDALAQIVVQSRRIEALERAVSDREEAAKFFAATASYSESEAAQRWPWLTWDHVPREELR